jgi:predicted amidohydrolase YtcJ
MTAADFIYFNGKITTLDPENKIASAIATQQNRIIFVGCDREAMRRFSKLSRRLSSHP